MNDQTSPSNWPGNSSEGQAQPPYQHPTPVNPPMNPGYQQPSGYYGPPNSGQFGQPMPPTNPLYPPPGQPGYPPYQPAFPQAGQPPQPPKRGLKPWQWILAGVGGLLIACCVCGAIAQAVSKGGAASLVATDTPSATDTPQPTATPVPPGTGDHMSLGHDYGQNSNGFYILRPANVFSSGQQIAYVVNLDQGIGTTQAKLVVVKEEAGGSESVALSIPVNISDPTYTSFANKVPTSALMYGDDPGSYKLELETDSAVVASAKFTYKG